MYIKGKSEKQIFTFLSLPIISMSCAKKISHHIPSMQQFTFTFFIYIFNIITSNSSILLVFISKVFLILSSRLPDISNSTATDNFKRKKENSTNCDKK